MTASHLNTARSYRVCDDDELKTCCCWCLHFANSCSCSMLCRLKQNIGQKTTTTKRSLAILSGIHYTGMGSGNSINRYLPFQRLVSNIFGKKLVFLLAPFIYLGTYSSLFRGHNFVLFDPSPFLLFWRDAVWLKFAIDWNWFNLLHILCMTNRIYCFRNLPMLSTIVFYSFDIMVLIIWKLVFFLFNIFSLMFGVYYTLILSIL